MNIHIVYKCVTTYMFVIMSNETVKKTTNDFEIVVFDIRF